MREVCGAGIRRIKQLASGLAAVLLLLVASLIGLASATATTPTAWSWGDNSAGQLGDGSTTNRFAPVAIDTELEFVDIATGRTHACGLTGDGLAYCWGLNSVGQLGDGTVNNSLTPTPVSMPAGVRFSTISAAGDSSNVLFGSTCAVATTGAAYCWGENQFGQLGDGSTIDRRVPTAVAGGVSFTGISISTSHTCGLTSAGAAYCWGRNTHGELGDGTITDTFTPVQVLGGHSFSSITTGGNSSFDDRSFTCALTQAGVAYCWGDNSIGQLGDNSGIDQDEPSLVSGGRTFTSISAGGAHACAITDASAAYCWGRNNSGQLGIGSFTSSPIPVAVTGGLDSASVSAGNSFTCGLTTAGVAYCWGRNFEGQLGVGDNLARTSPTAVDTQLTFARVVTGSTSASTYGIPPMVPLSSAATVQFADFQYFLPDGRECSSISPQRVQVGAMVELPGVDALCKTMPGSVVAGWTIPVPTGFPGAGSSSLPFNPGHWVRVIESQRFTVVPFDPVVQIDYDANIAATDTCTPTDVAHGSDDRRVAHVWVPRSDFAIARTATAAPCVPSGYELVGWNTRGDGSGQSLGVGEPLPDAWESQAVNHHTLFAVWRVPSSLQ